MYYGGKLANFGRDVHFLLRGDFEIIRKRGLRIVSKGENIHVPNIKAYRATADIGVCDLVVVAVKTTSNSDVSSLKGSAVKPRKFRASRIADSRR